MKAVWIIAALLCALLGLWWFASRHHEDSAPVLAVPDATGPAVRGERKPERLSASERAPASTVKPVAAEPAPTAEAMPATDLTPEEVQALEVETPPGVIEGIVLRGREPLTTGGLAYCGRGYFVRIREDPRNATADEGLSSTNIDPRGVFRFVGLELGDYTLAIDLGNGAEQQTTLSLATNKRVRRIVIVLGTATVKGHVYDMQGVPVANARVEVGEEFSRKGVRNFFTSRSTRADGGFEITNLPAGSGWLNVLLSGAWTAHQSDLMQKITLAPGEVLVIDFGAPEPARRWTGTLRTTGGDAVRGGGKMHLFRTDTNAYSTAKIEEDGTFVVLLPAGKYSVGANLNTNWAVRVRFPSIELGSVDLSQDLTLPGTRVHGVVIDESTGQPVGPEFKLGIGVRMRGANNSGSSAKLDAEGRFVVDGIEPGVWLVSSWPLKLVEGDHEIVVNKQDVEIPLRLTVKTRK